MAKDVTDETFESIVLKNEKPVLVDFWAEWCAPCRMMSPIVDEIGEEMAGEVEVYKIDVDMNPMTAATYGIRSIPSFLVFKDGELLTQVAGARPKYALKTEVEKALA